MTGNRRLGWTAGVVLAVVATLGAQQVPVFKAGIDAVLVDVEVLQGGRAVGGLGAADFQLLDNGVPQTVEAGLIKDVPIDVTVVVDTSGSVEGRRFERLKAGIRDTTQWLHPDDRWRVIAVDHMLHQVVPLEPAGAPSALDALQPGGGTALYDGLIAALMTPRTTGRRQMVIAYTDGADDSSIASPAALVDVARLSDCVVQVVVPVENARARLEGATVPTARNGTQQGLIDNAAAMSVSRAAESGGLFPNEDTFTQVTARTGGRVFVVDYNDSVGAAIKRVIEEYRTSYVLQYTRTDVPAEGWHDLTVKVVRPGRFDVRARKGYWGG